MGKKGKKSGRGKTAKNHYGHSGASATRSHSDNRCNGSGKDKISWEMLEPISEPTILKSLASKLLARIDPEKQRTESEPKGLTWNVWARRARMWLGEQDQTRGKKKSHRPWWINVVVCFPTMTVSASVLVEDFDVVSKTTDPVCLQHPLTAIMILAAIQRVVDEKGVRPPSEIVFWPGLEGSLRIESVRRLVDDLKNRVNSEALLTVKTVHNVTEIKDEGAPGGAASSFEPSSEEAATDCEGTLFVQNEYEIIRFMEEKIQHMETEIKAAENSYDRSSKVRCLSETLPQVSIAEMKLAFAAAAKFHDARPWELISNFHPLVVRVPLLEPSEGGKMVPSTAVEGGGSLRTFVAVVAGNGCWDSRGVYLYDKWDDMMEWASRSPRKIPQIVLQYYNRTWTSFRTLDHIEELGLEISHSGDSGKKNKYVAEDAYPCIYVTDMPMMMSMPSNQDEIWSTPPSLRDLNCTSLAIMAIAKFALNPDYIQNATSPVGKPGVSFAADPVVIDLELSDGTSFTSTVHMRSMENPSQCILTEEEGMHTFSIGAKKECNYCQKPESVTKRDGGVKLMECGRCHAVRYCSQRCQYSDWPRHKKECKKR